MKVKDIETLLRNFPEKKFEKDDMYWVALAGYLMELVSFGKESKNSEKTMKEAWKNLSYDPVMPEIRDELGDYQQFEVVGSRRLCKEILGYLNLLDKKMVDVQEELDFFQKVSNALQATYEARKTEIWYSYIEVLKSAFGRYIWPKGDFNSGDQIYAYYLKSFKYAKVLKGFDNN